MSRSKPGLGKANDKGVPEDELFLAEVVANAKALGIKRCTGTPFIYKNLTRTEYRREGQDAELTNACAIGAISLMDGYGNAYIIARKEFGYDNATYRGNDNAQRDSLADNVGAGEKSAQNYVFGQSYWEAME